MEENGELAIRTGRLILRDFRPSDLPDVYAFRSDPEVARYMDFAPETWAESRAWLDEAIYHNRQRPRAAYNLAIVVANEDRVIGWIGIGDSERYPEKGELGFGYALCRADWGQGYASEAARAVIGFGFRRLAGRRISAWCYAKNPASARVLEKAGLRFERRYTKDGSPGPVECLDYAIRVGDWCSSVGNE